MTSVVWDTSAFVAILLDEPEGLAFSRLLASRRSHLISAVSWLELSIVMTSRLGAVGAQRVAALMHAGGVQISAFDAEQAAAAFDAFARYGKGRHPASLNFGDCASYGLAITSKAELAFKGEEFSKTDLRSAIPAS